MLMKNVLEDFTNPVSEHDKLQNDDHDQDIFFECSEGFDIGMDNTCNQEKQKQTMMKMLEQNMGIQMI